MHRRTVGFAALLTLGLGALATAPAQADVPTTLRQLDYQGHRFTVPSSWQVVDLAKHPTACVRFDQHTVYLGHPSANQDCPGHLVGRTESLLLEPAANAVDRRGTVADPVEREYRAKADKVSVTATYDTDPALVRNILSGADIPATAPRVQDSTTAASRVQDASAAAPLTTASATALPATATNYTGKGFDTCAAPSSAAMSAWQSSSPYSAVGIYLGGSQRACSQPNLTAGWVQQQADAGWRFVPVYVGPQASGVPSPASQGISTANDAVTNAAALGFGAGSTLYYDMEAYSSSYSANVLAFESAWTEQLHARGYHSGIYSSSSSGINDLADNFGSYTMPDVIFSALWNGAADTDDPVVPGTRWSDHQRIHQYSGGHGETWGGTTINIDQDYLDVQIATDTATPHGRVWDRSRPDGGPWDPTANLIDAGGAVNAVAAAGLPNGTVHVETLVNGEIWDRTMSAAGTWGNASQIDAQGAITDVAAAALPDGTLHVQAVVNGEIWDRTRSASGTWGTSTQIDAGGAVTQLSSAGLPNGDIHVEAVVNGEVWDRVRKGTTGNWSVSSKIDGNGAIFGTYATGTPNGTLHVGTNA